MVAQSIRLLMAAVSPCGPNARLSILIFHRVLPQPDPLFPGEIDVRRFEQICEWLGLWCNVLPLQEAIKRLERDALPARAACLTFDDGYADNYAHALPILKRYGLHATFFIATGFLDGGRMWNDTLIEAVRATRHEVVDFGKVGLTALAIASIDDKRRALAELIPALKHREPSARADSVSAILALCGDPPLPDDLMLTSDDLCSLHAAGAGIGAHTVTHPILARCDPRTARDEIAASRDRLEALIGERVGLFAYPNGKFGADYTPDHVRLVSKLGFDAAVSTNPGASRRCDDRFQLARFTPWDRDPWRFGLRLALNATRRPHISR